ncbi:lipase/esterase family protein [Arthroderma uncinatum]|uniref:lipase/esterase family protein n=1 Tax=Arthroderma uncinatum TaxID=74035 RepID=UPI00144AC4EC|nr:lipase/esterase family protein [Arthroderma uncinatum]KAF3492396.1 lipase/esterase family protein [Arthroderma uncinatum]
MPFNIFSVAINASFTTVSTGLAHYLGKKPGKTEPAAHFSYHGGLEVIRRFLEHAARHTVEELQAFTGQKVPAPYWVAAGNVIIPPEHLESASHLLIAELGPDGVSLVGGSKWWQWRDTEAALIAEWVETRRDYNDRRARNVKSNRIMLYVHGGAYFFGSVDTHRYQLQRHARKLKARVFARMLVTLRDQNVPLPAGAVLISPWVDLTHSFPSVSGAGLEDYIPIYGFMHRPSMAWPPPNGDEYGIESTAGEKILNTINSPPVADKTSKLDTKAIEDFYTRQARATTQSTHVDEYATSQIPGSSNQRRMLGELLRVDIDGATVEIKDQIHLYTTNSLISHPLVSPVMQSSLGGLPPLLILSGGGEILRDEQIYLAHKAANPAAYPPSDEYLDRYDSGREILSHYKPTYVQLQVWNGLCHVAPTLSFTRPAKYMYRSIAQFSAWALSRAQESSIDIPEGSPALSGMSLLGPDQADGSKRQESEPPQFTTIGKAGDSIPPFKNHMIRQLVDTEGNLFPLPDEHEVPALQIPRNRIGVPKSTPVRRWLEAKGEWDAKFSREKEKLQKQRIKHVPLGIEDIAPGDRPPPSSLAARRGVTVGKIRQPAKTSFLLSFWSKLGAIHDAKAVQKEEKEAVDKEFPTLWRGGVQGTTVNVAHPRGRKNTRVVTDIGQSNESQRDLTTNPGRTTPAASVPQIWRSPSSEEFERTKSMPERNNIYSPSYTEDQGHSDDNKPTNEPPLDQSSTRRVRHSEGVISPPPVASSPIPNDGLPLEYTSLLSGPEATEPKPIVNGADHPMGPGKEEKTIHETAQETTKYLGPSRTIDGTNKEEQMMFDVNSAGHHNSPSEFEPFPPMPSV